MQSLQHIEVEGTRLAFREYGDPSAEPVVLLHGYPANGLCWRNQAPALGESHRVLALDWPGWGRSERRLDLRFHYDTEVARLGRVLDALGAGECNLLSHDYGGFLSLGLVQRQPQRVRRLAILNSRAHRTFVPVWYAVFAATSLLGRLPAKNLLRHVPLAAITRRCLRDPMRSGAIEAEVLDDYLSWMSEPEGSRWLLHFFGDYRVAARADLAAGLGDIACPTAIVWGRNDRYVRTRVAEELASGIPGAELTLLDADHFVMEEAPDGVLEALLRLLDT